MKIFTIGFTRKSARTFFGLLRDAKVKRLVDVRLNNVSQLAGFAKKDDLAYFTQALCGIDYLHELKLAPTPSMLDAYRGAKGRGGTGKTGFVDYERQFLTLMARRRIDKTLPLATLDGACLLCSEDKPHHCHRRLVAEYLARKWDNVQIEHLI